MKAIPFLTLPYQEERLSEPIDALGPEREVQALMDAVRLAIPLGRIELPDEFFPAHLSVALIDAALRPRIGERAVEAVKRYCRRFGIACARADRWEPPPVEGQETLSELVAHYEDLGWEAMAHEVLGAHGSFPDTNRHEARVVLDAARALQGIGIDVLGDMGASHRDGIEHVLRTQARMDEGSVRLLLMYTAGENFVHGDLPVRGFVGARPRPRSDFRPAREAARARGGVRAHRLAALPRLGDLALRRHDRRARPSACAAARRVTP